MNPLIQLKTTPPLLITITLLCFALLPRAQGVTPAPDGGYPGFNTAEGDDALFSQTGERNTAIGFNALFSATTGIATQRLVLTRCLILQQGSGTRPTALRRS